MFLQVFIYVFVKSSVLQVQFQTLGISLRLSIAVAIATAAVIPMNWKHSANYRCHQRGWKWLCTSKGKPLNSTNSNWQCKSNFPNSWSQRGPFNCSLFSSPSLFCPVPNFKCADLWPMGDLDPVPSRWKIQLTCSSSCLRYNPPPIIMKLPDAGFQMKKGWEWLAQKKRWNKPFPASIVFQFTSRGNS